MDYALMTRLPPRSKREGCLRKGRLVVFREHSRIVWVFGQAGRLARSGNSVGSVCAGHDAGPRPGATRQWYAGSFGWCTCFFRGQFLQYPFPSASCRSPSWRLEPFTHGDGLGRPRRRRSLPSLTPVGHPWCGEEESGKVGRADCEVGPWEGSRARILRADSCSPGGERTGNRWICRGVLAGRVTRSRVGRRRLVRRRHRGACFRWTYRAQARRRPRGAQRGACTAWRAIARGR